MAEMKIEERILVDEWVDLKGGLKLGVWLVLLLLFWSLLSVVLLLWIFHGRVLSRFI